MFSVHWPARFLRSCTLNIDISNLTNLLLEYAKSLMLGQLGSGSGNFIFSVQETWPSVENDQNHLVVPATLGMILKALPVNYENLRKRSDAMRTIAGTVLVPIPSLNKRQSIDRKIIPGQVRENTTEMLCCYENHHRGKVNLGRAFPYIFLFNFFKLFLNRVIGLLYEQTNKKCTSEQICSKPTQVVLS